MVMIIMSVVYIPVTLQYYEFNSELATQKSIMFQYTLGNLGAASTECRQNNADIPLTFGCLIGTMSNIQEVGVVMRHSQFDEENACSRESGFDQGLDAACAAYDYQDLISYT
jgi:hypothetical protein